MEEKIKKALSELNKSPKRNFKQTVDLIINIKHLDLKKPENQIDVFLSLPAPKGKPTKVCALVGPELSEQAKEAVDFVVSNTEFKSYDKKKAKKLSEDYDFFIGQANIMPQIATTFGRILGPKGKMPNPKAGCVVPPNANLKPLYDRLQKTVRLSLKKTKVIQTIIGKEDSSEKEIMDNAKSIMNSLSHNLPEGNNNIKSAYIKYTMGKPIQVM